MVLLALFVGAVIIFGPPSLAKNKTTQQTKDRIALLEETQAVLVNTQIQILDRIDKAVEKSGAERAKIIVKQNEIETHLEEISEELEADTIEEPN